MANNTLLESDSFGSGSLAPGWGLPGGTASNGTVVVGPPNNVQPALANGTSYGQIWTGISWPDHSSEVTVTVTSEAGTILTLFARWSSSVASGYTAEIAATGATIKRYDAGVPTTLKSVAGLTIAAGDTWTLQAAGAVISLYQNGKFLGFGYDATYTTGYPGFQQSTTVNVTHNKVFSWRGYSTVQVDGVWTKQGVVIPALAADVAASYGVASPYILYEGNAQILSGTVYKAWLSSLAGMIYCESLDGILWTRRAGTIIANFAFGHTIKVGGTYYIYCQPTGSLGSGNMALYTATDGVTFSQVSANVLAKGVSGWDAANFWDMTPITIIGGTWYALYVGTPDLNASPGPQIGLATSPDGVTWTKYGGNPVLQGAWITSAFRQIRGVWYFWLGANQPGQGNGSAAFWDPNECVRYKTTDFINWTLDCHSAHHAQPFESLNSNAGQNFPGFIIDIGGKAYFYTSPSPSDAASPHAYQVELATTTVPTSQLVTKPEDAVSQVATDSFARGAGGLGANWTTPTGGTALQIASSGVVEAGATSVNSFECYTGTSFNNNQYSDVTLLALASGNFVFPIVRCQTGALTFYEANVQGPTGTSQLSTNINRFVNGVSTQLGPTLNVAAHVGDVFRLAVTTGSDGFPILSLYQNGFLIDQVQDTSSSAIASGSPGFGFFATALANAKASAWAGGNTNVSPTYLATGASLLLGVG